MFWEQREQRQSRGAEQIEQREAESERKRGGSRGR